MRGMWCLALMVTVLSSVGCNGDGPAMEQAAAAASATARQADGATTGAAQATVVDSIIPIAAALERFQADVDRVPTGFIGGLESIEALSRRAVDLLAAADTGGFETITLDRAEFAYLYYEDSPLARPPYELPPELTWFRQQQASRTGVLRALREFGGRSLRFVDAACDSGPVAQGPNRIRSACWVEVAVDGVLRKAPLFNSAIERGGIFKVLSFDNDF